MSLPNPSNTAMYDVYRRAHDALRFPLLEQRGVALIPMTEDNKIFRVLLVDFSSGRGDQLHLRQSFFDVPRTEVPNRARGFHCGIGFEDPITLLLGPATDVAWWHDSWTLVDVDFLVPRIIGDVSIVGYFNNI